jgi:hypothetical protein
MSVHKSTKLIMAVVLIASIGFFTMPMAGASESSDRRLWEIWN